MRNFKSKSLLVKVFENDSNILTKLSMKKIQFNEVYS